MMADTAQQFEACQGCPVSQLQRLGFKAEDWDYLVALAGNPNTGKSTVFNALTGLRQHTGNWPGKTVGRMEGSFRYDDHVYRLVDLPGTYSLLAASEDEEVARDFILFGGPDVTIAVVDASRLERNLNLVFQILEITDRVVVALNLMDEANRHGLHVDYRALGRELGVPVVPTVARSGEGMDGLLSAVADIASGTQKTQPHRAPVVNTEFNGALAKLTTSVEASFPGLPNARWVALRLLDGDPRITEAVRTGELAQIFAAQHSRNIPAVLPSTAGTD